MKRFWTWAKADSGERVLRLDGAISDCATWYDDEITPKQFRAELNAGTGDISVWINSPGGDCFAAVQIFDMLKEYCGKVTVKVETAFSAASVVAMAGDVIEISSVGMFMIHNPYSLIEGDAEQLKSAANMLEQVKESIINAYQSKTKLTRQTLSEMMNSETWLNAQKAVELGFADRIIGEENQSTTARIFTPRTVKNSLRRALGEGRGRVSTADFRRRLNSLEE